MFKRISRRNLLKSALVLAVAAPLAQACAPKAPTEAAKPAPTQPKAAAPKAAEKKIALSIATYAGARVGWQRDVAKTWQEAHPEVDLDIIEVAYGEMHTKQLALLATGNLWDLSFSGIKWYPFSVVKGCFLPLDDLVASNDPGMDKFIPSSVDACRWEEKLYGLPYLLHPGNVALIASNLDLMGEMGVEAPTDDTTFEEYLEICKKASDPENNIFGTNYFAWNFYDIAPFMSFGSNVLDEEGKTFLVGVDPKATAAAQWITDLRVKHHVAPDREEAEGLEFQAGLYATRTLGSYYIEANREEVGDKFQMSVALHPIGPAGIRGWQPFIEMFSIYTGCEHPDVAYDLAVAETSEEAGILKLEVSSPSGRYSSWAEAAKKDDIYSRIQDWMGGTDSVFPMPYNVRFAEVQDTWTNNARDVFFGEIPFDEGIQKLQIACQAIIDLPRP